MSANTVFNAYQFKGLVNWVNAMVSTSVFQAVQCGHWPCHLLLVPPHSVQA